MPCAVGDAKNLVKYTKAKALDCTSGLHKRGQHPVWTADSAGEDAEAILGKCGEAPTAVSQLPTSTCSKTPAAAAAAAAAAGAKTPLKTTPKRTPLNIGKQNKAAGPTRKKEVAAVTVKPRGKPGESPQHTALLHSHSSHRIVHHTVHCAA